MKISYSWLQDYIDITESPEVISDALTQTGLEVEGLERIEKIKGGLEGLVVGQVVECAQHPNADKLKLTKVDLGAESLSDIVCGAPNVAQGQKVIVAPVNTTIYPVSGEPFKIKKAKIRGEVSAGMICAEDEIGLGESHEGVIVLDTDLPNGTPARELFDLGEDYIFEIGLTPNRGDATSHFGTARDLKAFYQRDICLPELNDPKIKIQDPIAVEVKNTEGCPRYSGVTIRGLKIAPSPEWLQWRLRSIGLEPINNVVDVTNYVLHSLGQPLHAFDADVVGDKILVQTMPEGTPFTTLDEKERKLSARDLMICNDKGGMCIAGVFGGIESGVKDGTTAIFLESACFSADWIRASAMRHGLSTDASFRFERGTDPEITITALKWATQLILEVAGGTVSSEFVDIYPEKVQPVEIATKFSTFDKLIGKQLPHDEISRILNDLDIQTQGINGDHFTAVVPAYRSEVTRPADLVEEVLRIHGINNIEIDESFSTGYLAEFDEIEPYRLQEDISRFLAGKGFHEILTNSITNKAYNEALQLFDGQEVELLNRSSEDLGVMKTTPLFTGLESIRYNLNRKQKNLRFFEFAKAYFKKDTYVENNILALYGTGALSEESWIEERPEIAIQNMLQWMTDILEKCGIHDPGVTFMDENTTFQFGATMKAQGKKMGQVGLVKPSITSYFNIEAPVFYAEMNWNTMLSKASRETRYQPISKFPEVRRDLSLVLAKSISYEEIRQIAFNSEKKLLTRMNVFSVFEGKQIGDDKKAYAIAFYLQDTEKTLKDKQIDKVMNNLVHRYEKELGAIIRK